MALDLHAGDFHLLYELTAECRIRSAGWFASRTVSEKAIVNDRWTSNRQYVLHIATHKMCCPHEKEDSAMYHSPFVLTRRIGRHASLKNACATSALLLTSPTRRSKRISAGRHEHEPRSLSTHSGLARNAKDAPRNLNRELLSLSLSPKLFLE